MAVPEVAGERTGSAEWSSSGKLRDAGEQLTALKWLREGAIDPDDGFDWSLEGWLGEETSFGMVYAVGPGGLAEGVNDELWVVELSDPIGIALSAEQRSHGGPHAFEVSERRVLARKGRLSRRVEGWNPDVALEFASECARRVAVRVCQSLSDSVSTLEEPGDLEGSLETELGPLLRRAGLEPDQRELAALRHAEELIGVWRDARISHSLRVEHPAKIYSTAAAASRAISVFAHSTFGVTAKPDRAAADRAYAEERRWQARWLVSRLGLVETFGDETFELGAP
jgi:hypothetical protein